MLLKLSFNSFVFQEIYFPCVIQSEKKNIFSTEFFPEKKNKQKKPVFFSFGKMFFLKFVHEEKLNSPDQKTFINLFFFHSLKKSIENILFLLDSIHDEKKSSL